jgi:hypothetical protein
MANTAVTKAMVDDTIPTQVASEALGALAGQLYLAAVADRNWEPDVATAGETVNVPVRAAVTANDKAAGTDVTLQQPSTTVVAITLDKHKEVSLLYEDVAKAFAKMDNVAGYARDAAIVIAEAIEAAGFVEAYTSFTTNADIGTAGTDLDTATFLLGRKRMKDAKVPAGQALYAFLSTKDILALLQLPEWRDADKTGSADAIENAPMQFKKFGVNVIESQYVQVVAGVPTTHNLVLCPKQGLALAMRPLALPSGGVISANMVGGVEGLPTAGLGIRVIRSYNHMALAELLTVDALFGWKVVRGAFGQDMLS